MYRGPKQGIASNRVLHPSTFSNGIQASCPIRAATQVRAGAPLGPRRRDPGCDRDGRKCIENRPGRPTTSAQRRSASSLARHPDRRNIRLGGPTLPAGYRARSPPPPTEPGDFIDDQPLCPRIWTRGDKDRTPINELIKRTRRGPRGTWCTR
jgi:hypothetical protein